MKHGGLDKTHHYIIYACTPALAPMNCQMVVEFQGGEQKKKRASHRRWNGVSLTTPKGKFLQNWGQKILFIFTHHSQGMLRKRIFELYGHFEWFPMVEANQKITQINNSQEINHYQPLHVWILTPNWYQNCRVNCCHPMTGQHLFEWQLVTTGTRICQEIRINI